MRPVAVLLAFCAVLAIATVSPSQESSGANQVDLVGFKFSPQDLTVNKGESVTWTNKDPTGHDVTFEAGFKSGEAGTLGSGQSWSHAFNSSGTFRYRCVVHSTDFASGMFGKIVVVDPAPPTARTPGFEFLALMGGMAGALLVFGVLRARDAA